MKSLKPLALAALLSLLAACQAQDGRSDTSGAPAAEPSATSTATTPAEPAPTAADAAPAAEAASEAAAATAAAPTPPPAAAPVNAAAPVGPAPVVGVDYELVENGQPFEPLNGKIEVTEFFGYACPACAQFEPTISAWRKRQPADVRVTPVALGFHPNWIPYAHAFYAAQTLNVLDQSHDAVFSALHLQRTLPEDPKPEDFGKFYAQYGVDPARFIATLNSFGVDAKVNRAKQYGIRQGVQSTPTVVVNGKYLVKGKSNEDILRIADHLIAQERAAAGR